jgi:hypothetical protein
MEPKHVPLNDTICIIKLSCADCYLVYYLNSFLTQRNGTRQIIQLRSTLYHRSPQMFFRPFPLFFSNMEIFTLFYMQFYFVLLLQFVIFS